MEKEENQNNIIKESQDSEKETPEIKKNLDTEDNNNAEQNKEKTHKTQESKIKVSKTTTQLGSRGTPG